MIKNGRRLTRFCLFFTIKSLKKYSIDPLFFFNCTHLPHVTMPIQSDGYSEKYFRIYSPG